LISLLGLFIGGRAGEARFARERFRQHDPVVGMIALREPVARRARAARLAVRQRGFAQQALREMLGKPQLADPRLPVKQQRMRPVGAQLLQAVPVVGLPRINHRLSLDSMV
jgi:hypothetical protein